MYISYIALFLLFISIALVYFVETRDLRLQSAWETSSGENVVLVHGILRGSSSMNKIKIEFIRQGFSVTGFDYTKKDGSIEEISDSLHKKIKKFPKGKIHFVTHSMGAVIVRSYISKYKPRNIGRVVMIAPPNNGSVYAAVLLHLPFFEKIFGRSGMDIAEGENCIVNSLPVPEFEFGVIAGGTGYEIGLNPFLKGDNDGTVLLKETIIEGMADFMQIKGQHSFLLFNNEVISESINFIKNGKFQKKS